VCSVQCVFVIWRAERLRHKREREQQGEASRRAGVCVLLVCVLCAVCVCNLEGTGATAQV